ncbi:hypothetical protein PR048_007166 [Dryococelus australis]|uniref:Uncharacterized protein n=1 Tax=Dryococelus australis TaxID=614101 RepID=A0ABQ9ICU9_9NEOP|nr:hypothetical protein PR048_007166 [Dryococelus australis]
MSHIFFGEEANLHTCGKVTIAILSFMMMHFSTMEHHVSLQSFSRTTLMTDLVTAGLGGVVTDPEHRALRI